MNTKNTYPPTYTRALATISIVAARRRVSRFSSPAVEFDRRRPIAALVAARGAERACVAHEGIDPRRYPAIAFELARQVANAARACDDRATAAEV